MWNFSNPVEITFGNGQLSRAADLINGRAYGLVTYKDQIFVQFASRLQDIAGPPQLVFDNVNPNPNFIDLEEPCNRIKKSPPEVIIALGGGSVIDTAKVLALALTGFDSIRYYLETKNARTQLPEQSIPIIAVPTTAGTGSEVTKWATVWDTENRKKYSLSRSDLYPSHAVIDPELMLALPLDQTISTGLDALSHALESIWNINANPISSIYAIAASKKILAHLRSLTDDLQNINLRAIIAEAALYAGLAFSNTRTAIAHSLSYPITLHHGVPHGIACSFTLPAIMRSVIGINDATDVRLRKIFGENLEAGASELETFIKSLNVPLHPSDYGVDPSSWESWISDALEGERGLNFIGEKTQTIRVLQKIMA